MDLAAIQEARRLARLLVGDTESIDRIENTPAVDGMMLSLAQMHADALVAQLALLREQHNASEVARLSADAGGAN